MSAEPRKSKLEHQKEASRFLRGGIVAGLEAGDDSFTKSDAGLLKFHGIYQQDDRDLRRGGRSGRSNSLRAHSFMVRTRIPGGKLTAEAFLAELELGERLGNGGLRITTRQGLQLHTVLQADLREVLQTINATQLTTLGACGDVERNVMCCPAPHDHDAVHGQMQATADAIAEGFKLRTPAYREIWMDGQRAAMQVAGEDVEPLYGKAYLPRKFKTGIALPEDNCIDVHTQDLGLLAIVEDGVLIGYNVLVGGGMGMTPTVANTYPRLATPLAYVTLDEVLPLATAILKIHRDFGNRADRKHARLKYILDDWGEQRFRRQVETYLGQPLTPPRPVVVAGYQDHIGWHEQGDGRCYLGLPIENGRLLDQGERRLKTGLRRVFERFQMPARLTAQQNILLCDLEAGWREEIFALLREHGVPTLEEVSTARRHAMACPALPTCGLALAESERVLPDIMDDLEGELARLGLADETFTLHMTGCPNGCARPYTSDVGLVGRSPGKYAIYLGGSILGHRLNFLYKEGVVQADLVAELRPLLRRFREQRREGESFGDFCCRQGRETLLATEAAASLSPA